MLEGGKDMDITGHTMPNFVYVSRGKSPASPHHFKAGALNVLVNKLTENSSILLDLLLGLQRKSKDREKEYYKNKTQKSVNTEKPSLVSVTISLKQIRRLPGARRNHFDVCFPGYNGGQAVPQHLDTALAN